jgi:uncharacterized protein YjgD (DUF1641 family)
MSQPIPLELSPRDPRTELQMRLQNAPLEHAEALLAAYQVLQGLHDRRVLELLQGALGSADKLIDTATEALNTPSTVRGLNNLAILARLFGTLDPQLLEGFARSLPEAIATTKAYEGPAPGFWGILTKFRNPNFRRGLVLINSLLEAFGKNLSRKDQEPAANQSRSAPA